jgi:NAD(P)-dependent dehydrogenase (short-subunit alcohol dehydrogenase family)
VRSHDAASVLSGLPIVVSGGSSGLGAAVVDVVTELGAKCVVLDRRPPAADVDHELVDLVDGRAAEAAVERAIDRLGGLGAVVTCAGIDACGRLEDIDAESWERVIAVNLMGTAAVVRAALPALRASHGRVVTIASTLGLRAVSDATAYCASKFGVVGFTRALAAETAGQIGVTLVVPGGMTTHFFDDRPAQYRPPADARLNSPSAVAQTIVHALTQPPGCEIREMVVCPSTESSWP